MKTPPAGPRRVLVATDFSDLGNQAMRHAHSLLSEGGTVLMLHVVHPQALPNGEYEHGVGGRHSHGQHAEYVCRCADQLRTLVPAEVAARVRCWSCLRRRREINPV